MFSVLMSVYFKENPLYLDAALNSIFEQTILAGEVVLVQDGALSDELYDVIDTWKRKLNIVDVVLPCNVGLGPALNKGLEVCKYEFVARMDTDDISLPHRFKTQLDFLVSNGCDVCGSWVSEFDTDPKIISFVKKVPFSDSKIRKFATRRNPMNHPSVFYRKSQVVQCGGYENVPYFEDYHLWLKMMSYGNSFFNIQDVLVNMRAGIGQLKRRSGISYAKCEFSFFFISLKAGYISMGDFVFNVCSRIPIRLLPKIIVSKFYSLSRNKF
ncbi:glycosyltransferase [Shewanella algae]|uniref:glycosyltransferase n=1 Tax=Shewanella algae TaxID=38313 RepID=UPI00373651F2